MTTLTGAPAPPNPYLHHDYYRDSWAHLNVDQRVALRKEYRCLRQLGLRPLAAKGALYRTVDVVIGWV